MAVLKTKQVYSNRAYVWGSVSSCAAAADLTFNGDEVFQLVLMSVFLVIFTHCRFFRMLSVSVCPNDCVTFYVSHYLTYLSITLTVF